jgi:hypothetical protein
VIGDENVISTILETMHRLEAKLANV